MIDQSASTRFFWLGLLLPDFCLSSQAIAMLKSLSSIQLGFDWQRLNQLAGEDPDFATELLAMFLQDAEESLARLDRAIEQRSLQAVEDLAHTLKGASANVGAGAILAVATQLEDTARCGEIGKARALLGLLGEHCEALRAELALS